MDLVPPEVSRESDTFRRSRGGGNGLGDTGAVGVTYRWAYLPNEVLVMGAPPLPRFRPTPPVHVVVRRAVIVANDGRFDCRVFAALQKKNIVATRERHRPSPRAAHPILVRPPASLALASSSSFVPSSDFEDGLVAIKCIFMVLGRFFLPKRSNPTDKCFVGGGCATARATNGMAQNQAQSSSPMVWG